MICWQFCWWVFVATTRLSLMNASHTHSSEHAVTCLHACDRVIFLCTVDLFGILCAFVFAHSHAQARIMCVVVWVCFLEFFFVVLCAAYYYYSRCWLKRMRYSACTQTRTLQELRRCTSHSKLSIPVRPSGPVDRPACRNAFTHTRTQTRIQPTRAQRVAIVPAIAGFTQQTHAHTQSRCCKAKQKPWQRSTLLSKERLRLRF